MRTLVKAVHVYNAISLLHTNEEAYIVIIHSLRRYKFSISNNVEYRDKEQSYKNQLRTLYGNFNCSLQCNEEAIMYETDHCRPMIIKNYSSLHRHGESKLSRNFPVSGKELAINKPDL